MLESLHRLFGCCRPGRILGSKRLAGLNPVSKSLAKHADRTKLHCSRKLVTATRTGTLGLRAHAHGPNRSSAAFSAESNATLAPTGAKAASTAPGKLLSRCTRNSVFLYTSASNHVSEQN